ncbi:MAG TPA: regulatory protein RecX [Candidatus Dormibacteraeota bacterium]
MARHKDPTRRTARAEHTGVESTGVVFGAPGAPGTTGAPGATDQDPETRARQICLRLLTLAPRTRAQLAAALRDRGVPDDAAHAILDRFADVGLIDDAAFARAWVESRHYSRGLAGRALRAELRQRGVDDDQIQDAIEDLGPDAEVATARRLVEQRLASTRGLPSEARIRRLAGMLARKGYPPGLAFRVVRESLEAEGAPVEASCFDDLDTYTD